MVVFGISSKFFGAAGSLHFSSEMLEHGVGTPICLGYEFPNSSMCRFFPNVSSRLVSCLGLKFEQTLTTLVRISVRHSLLWLSRLVFISL